MKPAKPFILAIWCGLLVSAFAQAQATPREPDQLLSLLPDDFAVCVVLHDLRANAARWEKSDWLKQFRLSPVGKSLLSSPEFEQFSRWQGEMKKHLDLDWPALRDDILGDHFIMAYYPGTPTKPKEEHGLFLFQARKPQLLTQFIEKLNAIQTRSGELKSVTKRQWKGTTYFVRDQGGKAQFYFIKDSLAAVATRESVLQELIQRLPAQPGDNTWVKRFQRAKADRALLTLCINPREVAPDVVRTGKKSDALPGYWRALEAIFVTLSVRDQAELHITIQANPQQLPGWSRLAFTETIPVSSLWQHFPEKSLLTVAGKTDFTAAAEALKLVMQEKDRIKLGKDWASIGAVLKLEPFKDILPNVGPDWGLCVLPARNPQQLPEAIFALAARPGSKEKQVDRSLLEGIDFFAKLAVLNNANDLRLQDVKQGNVVVKYLTSEKLFPPGFRPACALKDGYLLLATSPAAIADFGVARSKATEVKESLLLRLSAPGLATLLEQRRPHVIAGLTNRQQMTSRQAQKNLDNVIGILGLFDHLTLSHVGGDGQAQWILRLAPAPK